MIATRVPFFEAVADCTGGNAKVQKKDYLPSGDLAVIDQGVDFIGGYTDSSNKYSGVLPVVLFGDHTRALKYVDFPFALGADGIKVLQPSDGFEAKFLFYYFRSVKLPNAGYSRHFKFLKEVDVPKPPLSEQRRIVDLLSRAEGIVRLRREAHKKAASIIPALFLDMFGDPARNPMGWKVVQLGDVIRSADYGSSSKASDDAVGLPLIRMGNVDYAGGLDLSDLKYVELDPKKAEHYRLAKGDLLFNRTNSKELVGKTGLWDEAIEAVVASYFIRVRVNETLVRPFFVWAFMNTKHMKRVLFDTARGAIGQANINTRELRAFQIPLPDLKTQEHFEERCRALLAIQKQQAGATVAGLAVFNSLLARLFASPNQEAIMRVAPTAEEVAI